MNAMRSQVTVALVGVILLIGGLAVIGAHYDKPECYVLAATCVTHVGYAIKKGFGGNPPA